MAVRALSLIVRDNIAAEAARRRVTQGRIGATLGMSRQAVAARYRGLVPWSLDEVQAVAVMFGVTLGELLTDHTPPPASSGGPAAGWDGPRPLNPRPGEGRGLPPRGRGRG